MGSKVELIKDESLNCRKLISISPQKNEEEEDDDGPPPGFDSLPLNLSKDIRNILNEKEVSEDDDDDGPPPGFQPISLKNTVKVKKDGSFIENIDDNDEPPPGFQSISLKNTPENRKGESFIGNIDGDDGPPPGFHSVHVIKQVDDVSVSDSHSVFGDGLNPNSQSDLKILGNESKLGFGSIHVKEEGNSGGGLNAIYQSDLKIVDECELGLKSVSAKEEGKNGDESGLKSFNSYSEKGEENIIDVSELGLKSVSVEEPELRLQSISEKGKENGKEKARDDSELGFESVSNRDLVKESDESDVGSQPLPMIEDEKEDNVCGTGLQSISQKVGREEKNDDNDDDDGPPPGWGSFLPPRPSIESPVPPHQPRSPVSPRTGSGSGSAHVRGEERVGDELEVGSQLDPMKEDGKEDDSSELDFQSFPVITEEKGSTPVKEEENDNEGPPSGWFSRHPSKGLNKALSPPKLPPLTPAQFDPIKEDEKERDGSELESLSFPAKMEGKGPTSVKEDEAHEGPPPGWYSCHPSKEPRKALSPLTPAPPNPLLSAIYSEEKGPPPVKEEEDHEGPPPGWYSCHPSKVRSKALSPPQLPPVTPAPLNPQPSATSFGKAQMVCGSCRTLLSYSKGSRFVQCSCCQTVNLVLEEHQVGQVKCRGCTLLLMYPYGAPSVQCSSCLFVTKVGVQNKRPPLSLQQGRPQLLTKPVT